MGCSNFKAEEMKDNDSKVPDFILSVSKSIVKLNIGSKTYSGFLIKLFIEETDFFCLLTVGECISSDMIERNDDVKFYYDNETKIKKISLNKNERFIKNFSDVGVNSTVIEIIPTDAINKDYFLLPVINYAHEFNELKNEEIYIVHNPKGILNFQNAKIKEIKGCEFTLAIKNELNSSGNPIFLKGGTKVIGITQSLNKAYFIGPILNYFQNFQDNHIDEHQFALSEIKQTQNYTKETNYKNGKKEKGIIKHENGDYYKGGEKKEKGKEKE